MNYHELSPELYEIEHAILNSGEFNGLIDALDEHDDEGIEDYCSMLENIISDETGNIPDDYDELANNIVYFASSEFPWCSEMLKASLGI